MRWRGLVWAAWLVCGLATRGGFGDEPHAHEPAHHNGQPGCDGSFHGAFAPEDYPPPFGFDLFSGWRDEWPHSHFSRSGTPMVHFFFTEPGYLGRDLFVDYVYTRTDDGKEHEIASELEWAFTRRIGMVIEVPGLIVNPVDGVQEEGFGDLVVAPRFLIADFDRFMLSANLEISTPTGDADRGLGAGEVILGPSLTGWLDLGNWWTSGFRIGTEAGLESGDAEVVYDVALARTFCGRSIAGCGCNGHRGHGESENGHGHEEEGRHFPPGMTSLIAEFNGRTLTSGPEQGRATAELLFGVSYTLSEHLELRAGYQVPLYKPHDIEERIVTGFIYHF